MHRREFLKSALVVPALASTGGLAVSASPAAAVAASSVISLAYWSRNQAWMIAADAHIKASDSVSPLLSLPGRRFANRLRDLDLLQAGHDTKPCGLIAPAEFAGEGEDAVAVKALSGMIGTFQLTSSDVAAWLSQTAVQPIWADIVHQAGWHPLAIGALAPASAALVAGEAEPKSIAATGLTRQCFADLSSAPISDIFDQAAPAGTLIGAAPPALISSFAEAGTRMSPQTWRLRSQARATATGPVIAAFFDLDWWEGLPRTIQRAIEMAAEANVAWHLAQQHMATAIVAAAAPKLIAPARDLRTSDQGFANTFRNAVAACDARIAESAAAQAIIGPLIELGRANQSHYPSV